MSTSKPESLYQQGEAAIGNPVLYAEYIAQTVLGAPVGSVSRILDGEAATSLEVAVVTDPARIYAYKTGIADQMNAQSNGPTFTDLSERIADLKLSTLAQGASTIALSIIDPTLSLLHAEDEHGNTFIQTDQNGYIWPPIDLNYPLGTDCWWRLCQVDGTRAAGSQGANLTLTFEDRIASWLREVTANLAGVSQGSPDQSLGSFIAQLVSAANRYLKGHPDTGGKDLQPIRFVSLLADNDPNIVPPATAPASSKPTAPLARQNPNKTQQGLTAAQKKYIEKAVSRLTGKVFSLAGLEQLPSTVVQAPTVGQVKNGPW